MHAAQGDLRGCADLGNLYQLGQGVRQDYSQARTLFQKACDGGEMVGCSNLGLLDANGLGAANNSGEAFNFIAKPVTVAKWWVATTSA